MSGATAGPAIRVVEHALYAQGDFGIRREHDVATGGVGLNGFECAANVHYCPPRVVLLPWFTIAAGI